MGGYIVFFEASYVALVQRGVAGVLFHRPGQVG